MRHILAAFASLALITAGCSARQTVVPAPSDFAVSIQVLSKKCFGSAGCVLTYRIQPTYNGPALDGDQEVTVTYEVTGGNDIQINSFEVRGSKVRYDRKEVIRTPPSAPSLSVQVTNVF